MQPNIFLACGLALVVSLYPIFPVLARGAVFAAELKTGDLGVAQLALAVGFRCEVLHPGIGKRGARVTVEDVGFNLFTALERDADIPAVIEGLFERSTQLIFIRQFRNPALQFLMLCAGREFEIFDLVEGVFEHFGAHARVSSSSRSGRVICTSDEGPCGAGSFNRSSPCWSRYVEKVPRIMPQNPLSEPKPSITALGS